jgi:VWFA-related protein
MTGRPAALALLATVAAVLLLSQPGLGFAAAGAPEPGQPPPTDAIAGGFAEQVGVGWVLVPVVVRPHSGDDRGRLDEEDFRLLVDGRPVPIDTFERRAEAPLSLVVLQDLSGSMANVGKLEASRQAIDYFLDTARDGDEFALASFAGGLTQVDVPFTQDRGALREALAAWEGWGTTALHDAVAWLPDISLNGRNPKRAALLVTDGIDNASTIPPTQARDLVRRAQLPVYVLGLRSGDPYTLASDGEKLFRYADLLNLLAYSTGGQYHAAGGPDEVKEACAAIAEDLRTQYVLSFPTKADGPVRDRAIRVEVDAGKSRIFFRRSYRGRPPAAAG